MALLRNFLTHPEANRIMRDEVMCAVIRDLAQTIGGPDAELKAALLISCTAGWPSRATCSSSRGWPGRTGRTSNASWSPACAPSSPPNDRFALTPTAEEELVRDYPQVPVQVGHVEPVPRRVRAYVGATRSSTRRPRATCGSGRPTRSTTSPSTTSRPASWSTRASRNPRGGAARLHKLHVGGQQRPGARVAARRPRRARGHRALRLGGAGRLVRGGRAGLRPPAQPVRRVDALRSDRHGAGRARRRGAGRVASPVLVFETGLPTRYYLDRTDVRLRAPGADRHRDRVPVQGRDERLLVGRGSADAVHRDLAWTYDFPTRAAAADRRAGRVLQREGRLFVDGGSSTAR